MNCKDLAHARACVVSRLHFIRKCCDAAGLAAQAAASQSFARSPDRLSHKRSTKSTTPSLSSTAAISLAPATFLANAPHPIVRWRKSAPSPYRDRQS